jgi:acylphosphatase
MYRIRFVFSGAIRGVAFIIAAKSIARYKKINEGEKSGGIF